MLDALHAMLSDDRHCSTILERRVDSAGQLRNKKRLALTIWHAATHDFRGKLLAVWSLERASAGLSPRKISHQIMQIYADEHISAENSLSLQNEEVPTRHVKA